MKLIKLSNNKRHYAVFLCVCGKEFETYKYNVLSGHTKSCGCLASRNAFSHTRAYKAWLNMKTRCLNSNTPYYYLWGGRGIAICSRWLDYNNFLVDMGQPKPRQSLDRIDVNGNYEPSNCRWSTQMEQCNNQRRNRKIGSLSVSQTARKLGMKPNTLLYRLRRGWTLEEAVRSITRRETRKNIKEIG